MGTGVRGELRSVEISYFVHATEDLERITSVVMERLDITQPPELEYLEGHFGNRIVHAQHHLTDGEAMTAFRTLVSSMGGEVVRELREGLEQALDEHEALYVRLGKQELIKGATVLSQVDPIRIKVRPRGFMMKGKARAFYRRLLGEGEAD